MAPACTAVCWQRLRIPHLVTPCHTLTQVKNQPRKAPQNDELPAQVGFACIGCAPFRPRWVAGATRAQHAVSIHNLRVVCSFQSPVAWGLVVQTLDCKPLVVHRCAFVVDVFHQCVCMLYVVACSSSRNSVPCVHMPCACLYIHMLTYSHTHMQSSTLAYTICFPHPLPPPHPPIRHPIMRHMQLHIHST